MSFSKKGSKILSSSGEPESTKQPVHVRDRSGTEFVRPQSGGLNKDFLAALDQKIAPKFKGQIPRVVSDSQPLPELVVVDTSEGSKRKNMHRRTASTGAPKEKVKIRQTTDLGVENIKSHHRKSANFGKGKKLSALMDKKKARGSAEAPSETTKIAFGELDADKLLFSQFLLRASLAMLGYAPKDITEIETKIVRNYVPSNPNVPFEKLITTIQNKLQDFNGAQNKHVSAIKIQSAFRTYRIRKNIKPLLGKYKRNNNKIVC